MFASTQGRILDTTLAALRLYARLLRVRHPLIDEVSDVATNAGEHDPPTDLMVATLADDLADGEIVLLEEMPLGPQPGLTQ